MKIENNIRYLRFINGEMTQSELAQKVKCTRQTIAALEKFRYNPSLELAYRIATAFDKSIEDVFTFSEE